MAVNILDEDKVVARGKRRMESEMFLFHKKVAKSLLPPPLPPPLSPMAHTTVRARRAVAVSIRSVTRDEITRYWRVEKMEEEEYLLAALKAAVRIRARTLSEEDFKGFEESIEDVIKRANEGKDGENNRELQVGIKDWWTSSKYAYLKQPSTKSLGEDKRSSSKYKPCSCSPAASYFVANTPGAF